MKLKIFFIFAILLSGCSSPDKRGPSKTVKIEGPDSYPVYMTAQVKGNLAAVYSSSTKEIPFCLYGRAEQDSIVINRADFPDILTATDSSVVFSGGGCAIQSDFLGYVHNHDPSKGSCMPSDYDIRGFVLDPTSKVEIIGCPYSSNTVFYAFTKNAP